MASNSNNNNGGVAGRGRGRWSCGRALVISFENSVYQKEIDAWGSREGSWAEGPEGSRERMKGMKTPAGGRVRNRPGRDRTERRRE